MLDSIPRRVKRLAVRSVPLVIALLIGSVATFVVFPAVFDADEYERTVERVEAYCYQTTGSDEVYTAMVVGNHGGLHCEESHGGPHVHDVTDEALTAAWVANESGEQLDWSTFPGERYEPRYDRGHWPDLFSFVSLAFVLLLIIIVLGVLVYGPRL